MKKVIEKDLEGEKYKRKRDFLKRYNLLIFKIPKYLNDEQTAVEDTDNTPPANQR